MDMIQTEYVDTLYLNKKCSLEGCHQDAGSHLFYDSTLCKEHGYDDEVHNMREANNDDQQVCS